MDIHDSRRGDYQCPVLVGAIPDRRFDELRTQTDFT
jgi:hypothetical protein